MLRREFLSVPLLELTPSLVKPNHDLSNCMGFECLSFENDVAFEFPIDFIGSDKQSKVRSLVLYPNLSTIGPHSYLDYVIIPSFKTNKTKEEICKEMLDWFDDELNTKYFFIKKPNLKYNAVFCQRKDGQVGCAILDLDYKGRLK